MIKDEKEDQNGNVIYFQNSATLTKSPSKKLRIKLDVVCDANLKHNIRSGLTGALEKMGCANVVESAEWVLSIIAYHYSETIIISIILRRLFRSTTPGTEMDEWIEDDGPRLKEGGWVYESLRFHGLYGVHRNELESFLEKMVLEFKFKHWSSSHTRVPLSKNSIEK